MILHFAKGKSRSNALKDTPDRVDFTEEDASCQGFSGRLCFKVINLNVSVSVKLVFSTKESASLPVWRKQMIEANLRMSVSFCFCMSASE